MTKKEKKKINEAIAHLANDRWQKGMDILFDLVGRKKLSDYDTGKTLKITDIPRNEGNYDR